MITAQGVLAETLPEPNHEEVYGGSPFVWKEIPEPYNLPSQRFQSGQDEDCVGHSTATFMEANTGVVSSAQPIYRSRRNYPDNNGMFLSDAGNIAQVGTTTEAVIPSNNVASLTLDQEALPPLAERYIKALGTPVYCSTNIDQIAEAISTAKAVLMTFVSNGEEWQLTPSYLGTPTTFGHCITGLVPTLRSGVKVIVSRDSAGRDTSPTGIRYITQDFLTHRCTGVMYWPKAIATPPVAPTEPTPAQKLSWVEYFYRLFGGKGNPYK